MKKNLCLLSLLLLGALSAHLSAASAVHPSALYAPEPVVTFDALPDEERPDDAGDNKTWHEAGYRQRLAHVLQNKARLDADEDILYAKMHNNAALIDALKAYAQQSAHVMKQYEQGSIEKKDLDDLKEAKEAFEAANVDLSDDERAKLRQHQHSLFRRMWRGSEAVGLAPGLVADLADVIGFGSSNKQVVGGTAALSGTTRLLDTFLNKPVAHMGLSQNQAEVYRPHGHRRFQVSPELRRETERRVQMGAAAQALTGLSQYIVQPVTTFTDSISTVKNSGAVAAYNRYLNTHKNDPRLAKQRAQFRRKQYLAGGMIGFEALLHALKYAAYLKQGGDPARYYASGGDARWVNWANAASALAAAVAMARRGWWNWQKTQHIDAAQSMRQLHHGVHRAVPTH